MRPQCRGCCLSRSGLPDDWGRYDLSSVPGRTGEMRLTAVVARAQRSEFLTQRHILSMKWSNDQTIAFMTRSTQGDRQGSILYRIREHVEGVYLRGIKTVVPCSVLQVSH